MDEITRTLIPEGGFGGGNALSLGAGAIGGLVLGSLALAHKIRNM